MVDSENFVLALRKPVLQALQDWFAMTYKVGTGILDEKVRPLTFETNHAHYCKAIRRTPLGLRRCRNSDTCLVKECKSRRDVAWRCCNNGLLDFAVPIMVGRKTVAYFFGGQLRGSFGGIGTNGGNDEIRKIVMQCRVPIKGRKRIISELKEDFDKIRIRTPEELAKIDLAARQFGNLLLPN